MAREIRMLLVVCVCILIQANFAAEKMRRLQKIVKGKTDACAMPYIALIFKHVLESVIYPSGKICGRWRKSVTKFRKTGETRLNVSTRILLTQKRALKVIDEEHTKGVPGCFKMLNLTEWTVEETCFRDLLRGTSGETSLPTGLLEEAADSTKQLSKRRTLFLMYIILETQMFRKVHKP